ncbi:hypothetical protein HCN44_004205 [Aphidius gifuensis]|uniref:Sas10 C-terminal domain-containing protein n=2 Tax=Aphidius gifuensis TaxID=684658 RepID=A0A834XYR1_APHGI|nr:hypothetical protein HCN44_004205 [Aphidius gifuensis]
MKKQEEDFGDIDQYDDDNITDSDDEFSDSDRKRLEKVRKRRVEENFDSDDEIFGLNLDDLQGDYDDEEEEEEEDDDEAEPDYDMPDERAWGKKKGLYYSTDYVDQDYSTTNEKDLQKAKLEEESARAIQKRLAEQLDEADFNLHQFSEMNDDDKNDQDDDNVVVSQDLSKLSKREKLAFFRKESPEFEPLVNDSRARLTEMKDILSPFIKLAEEKKFPNMSGVKFIQTKYRVSLNYITNMLFYLMLKAKRIPVTNHPVIKRLAQFRLLLTHLENKQGDLLERASKLIASAKEEDKNYDFEYDNEKATNDMIKSAIKTTKPIDNKDKDEEKDVANEDQEESAMQLDESNQENLEDEKRGITYQIAKNKGLTPHRKKELRNPRVKHRNKYRKAIIRRKGAVREVRKETTRYDGEWSGINASVIKSIKIK